MKTNKQGFSAVELLIALLVIGLLAGIGYYVYQSNQSDPTPASSSEASPPQTEGEEPDETEEWVSFTPNSELYTIKLPDGWEFQHQDDECDCLITKSMGYEKGVEATVEKVQGGRDGATGLFVVVDDKDLSAERFEGIETVGEFTADSLVGTKYYNLIAVEPEGIGNPKGTKEYYYYFKKSDKFIYVSYASVPDQPSELDVVEKAIKTLE